MESLLTVGIVIKKNVGKMENKIVWRKPDYKNRWKKVSDKEVERHCIEGTSNGDIKIEKEIHGRRVIFTVFRVEKEGELIRGIETLSRQQLIEEVKKLEKKLKITALTGSESRGKK